MQIVEQLITALIVFANLATLEIPGLSALKVTRRFLGRPVAFLYNSLKLHSYGAFFLVIPSVKPTPITQRPECRRDDECSDDKACFDHRCQNPCIVRQPCGINAECRARDHSPFCTCLPGYRGNPLLQCTKGRVQRCSAESVTRY